MTDKKIYDLYEKLYFHEITARENLNNRLQMPLVILMSLIGFLAFMLSNYQNNGGTFYVYAFWAAYASSLFYTGAGVWCFVKSWYNYTYAFLPSAIDTENYRKNLMEIYNEYDESGKLANMHFEKYLINYYVECSTANTNNNDKRSGFVHLTTRFILTGTIFAFVAFLPYYFGDLNKNNRDKIQKIVICDPSEAKEQQ